MGYSKLFSSILASTIWNEDDATRIVWITMLAMKDRDGIVEGSVPGLAVLARVSKEACERAIAVLSAPDPSSRTKTHEGRRIEACPEGWLVINHHLYQERGSAADHREKTKLRVQRFRERQAVTLGNGPKRNETVEMTSGLLSGSGSHSRSDQPQSTERATKRASVRSEADPDFDRFWSAYDKKVDREAARKAWRRLSPSQDLIATIIDRAAAYVRVTPDKAFRKNAATWLNGRCWENDLVQGAPFAGRRQSIVTTVGTDFSGPQITKF